MAVKGEIKKACAQLTQRVYCSLNIFIFPIRHGTGVRYSRLNEKMYHKSVEYKKES